MSIWVPDVVPSAPTAKALCSTILLRQCGQRRAQPFTGVSRGDDTGGREPPHDCRHDSGGHRSGHNYRTFELLWAATGLPGQPFWELATRRWQTRAPLTSKTMSITHLGSSLKSWTGIYSQTQVRPGSRGQFLIGSSRRAAAGLPVGLKSLEASSSEPEPRPDRCLKN